MCVFPPRQLAPTVGLTVALVGLISDRIFVGNAGTQHPHGPRALAGLEDLTSASSPHDSFLSCYSENLSCSGIRVVLESWNVLESESSFGMFWNPNQLGNPNLVSVIRIKFWHVLESESTGQSESSFGNPNQVLACSGFRINWAIRIQFR